MRLAITVSLVPEAAAGPFVFHGDLDFACARAAAHGYRAIELFPPSGDSLDARAVRQLLHRNRLDLAAVGTGAGWLTRKLSLTHPDPAIREKAQQFVAAVVDFAGAFGAPTIIGSMQGRAEPGTDRDRALGWLAEALEQLGPRAHGYGVPLLLEPLNRYESNLLNTLAQAGQLLETLRTRNVRLLADWFHMNIEETNLPGAIRAAGSAIGHVHFADSNRLAVGCGHTDAAAAVAALREIGYQGYLSAEILPKPDPEDAARLTMDAYRGLFPNS